MMKVLLLNPMLASGEKIIRADRCQSKGLAGFGIWPPISLMEIGAVLRKNNFEVVLMDAVVKFNDSGAMLRKIIEEKAELTIFHNVTPTLYCDLEFAEYLKKNSPEVKIAFYGLHATARPEDVLSGQVDFAIRGEPELSVLELCKYLGKNPDRKPDLSKIQGLSYKINGNIMHNQDREPIVNLDDLPFPERSLIDKSRYIIPSTGRAFTIIKTSRGCPFRCIFCTSTPYYKGRWRYRSAKNIFREIEEVYERHSIRDFMFLSDTFNIKESEAIALCDLIINGNKRISWICNTRADTITAKMASKMKQAGCWLVSIGAESGSDEILKNAKKGLTTFQIEEAVKIFKSVGIRILCYFMFGLPGETKETIRKSIEFAKRLDIDYAQFYSATPFPGTEFYELAKKNKWLLSNDWGRYFHGISDVIAYDGLSAEDIKEMKRIAYQEFYFRPRVFLRELKDTVSFRDLMRKIMLAFQIKKFSSANR